MGKSEINHMKLHKTSNGMLLMGQSGIPEYTTGKKKTLEAIGDSFSKVPRSQMLLNCNPLPLKR